MTDPFHWNVNSEGLAEGRLIKEMVVRMEIKLAEMCKQCIYNAIIISVSSSFVTVDWIVWEIDNVQV